MKNLIILILTLTALNGFAQHKLEVTIVNIKEIKGAVRVALYNNENDFMKTLVDKREVKVSGNQATIVFEKLAPGEYAISLYQDLNDNKKLDTGFMGIPQEPYGFSNDARGKFGPPSYEKAKFIVKATSKMVIKVE